MPDPIQTHYIFPPIPLRQFDWCAYRNPESKVVGWARTEAEALTSSAWNSKMSVSINDNELNADAEG